MNFMKNFNQFLKSLARSRMRILGNFRTLGLFGSSRQNCIVGLMDCMSK